MSTYRDTSTSHDITTDAGFRAWAQMVHDGLAAVGMVQTADTGQINLASVTTPGSNSTYAGYEIWRFNDSQQGSTPIYFKIEYGRGAGASQANWRWNVGTGSDGAGTITNSPGALATNASNAPSGTPEFVACAIEGVLVLAAPRSASAINVQMYAQIERLRDENGNIITGANAGFTWAIGGGSGGSMRRGSTNTSSQNLAVMGVPSGAMNDGRKRVGLQVTDGTNPMLGFIYMKSGEVAAGDVGSVQVYGTTHTYRVLTPPTGASISQVSSIFSALSLTLVVAILYE